MGAELKVPAMVGAVVPAIHLTPQVALAAGAGAVTANPAVVVSARM